jgi:hypothetical protein
MNHRLREENGIGPEGSTGTDILPLPLGPRLERDPMPESKVVRWLLEEDQPAVRYRTLRELLERPETDSDVRAARERIPRTGWAARVLEARRPDGWWNNAERIYQPKYLSTNWMLLVLSDLGVDRSVPEVRESCELWMKRSRGRDGGFSISPRAASHHCYVGNMARALVRFGYADDPRVRAALDWLVRTASPLGGWSCFGSGRNLDSWEGLSAFAAYPRAKWTATMQACVEKAAEFYLDRELHRQGSPYAPWMRFHYPVHYYYDLLVGLDLLTSLGYADDPRLRFALSVLDSKRRRDGRWNLDALHPDVEGSLAKWLEEHPSRRPIPFGLEPVGRPSKLITLTAEKVRARVDGTI